MALGALALAGSALGILGNSKARKLQRRAEALQRQRTQLANIQARRAAAANLRRMQAQQTVQAMITGGGTSSGNSAAASSLRSQSQTGIGNQVGGQLANQQVNSVIGRANKIGNQAATVTAFGQLAGQASQVFGTPVE